MDEKRWPIIGISLLMILLIYSFLTTVFKSDQKRFNHDRIFVDYSDYRQTNKAPPARTTRATAYRHPNAYKAAQEANDIKRTMFSNVMTATISTYNAHMSEALKNQPSPSAQYPKPIRNKQYEQIINLSMQPAPDFQSGMQYFSSGNYERALEYFNSALDKVDQMDVKHRIDIFSMMAECYLKLKSDDGYIQNKIRQVRMERRLKQVIQAAFPEKADSMHIFDWSTTQEASKQLLRMRSLAAKSNSPQMYEMLKRAELDLEVARKVTQ
jgi:tetratricopeptide (TPR) repeat protein